jgi:hypothetical protein
LRPSDRPAPDIIAEFVGCGRAAFKFVRLNDPDQLTRPSLMHQTPRFLQTEFGALLPEQRAQLTAKFLCRCIASTSSVRDIGSLGMGDGGAELVFGGEASAGSEEFDDSFDRMVGDAFGYMAQVSLRVEADQFFCRTDQAMTGDN